MPERTAMDLAILRAAIQPTNVADTSLADYLPHFLQAMTAAQINTVNRAAAWCSQLGHETAGLKYMAEIQTSSPTWNVDRTRYRGRGPIQLTWKANYRKFGIWCKANGYVTDSEMFVNQPELVEQPKWGFLAASWYWLNAGPRPGQINTFADAGDILAVSRCVNGWIEGKEPNGFPDRQARWNRCLAIGSALLGQETTVPDRPDFNEVDQLGFDAADPHGSVRSRPPINFFLHTEQPAGSGIGAQYDSAATDLAAYLRSTKGSAAVSYHYTIRQATDGGVTVVDVIDTDLYSWAVLSANVFSINLCFAGSKAEWTRDQWMTQTKAIDVAAYLAVQDCRKYNFSTEVIAPPYGKARAGISDHKYVTQCLGIGTHTDVGNNFPWDVFAAAVAKYVNADTPGAQPPPVVVTPPTLRQFPKDFTDRELIEWLVAQLGDGDPTWPSKGMTLRDKVWSLGQATS